MFLVDQLADFVEHLARSGSFAGAHQNGPGRPHISSEHGCTRATGLRERFSAFLQRKNAWQRDVDFASGKINWVGSSGG